MERLIDEATSTFLKDVFDKTLKRDVDIKMYSSQKGQFAEFTAEFFRELGLLSDKIKIDIHSEKEGADRGFRTDPYLSFGEELGYRIYFNGTPAGHEANTIIDTIKMISTGEPELAKESLEAIKKIDKPVKLQTFVTTSCPYCPQAATLANRFAVANTEYISSEIIEAEENLALSENLNISSVPIQVVNEDRTAGMLGVQPENRVLSEVMKHGSSVFTDFLKEQEKKKIEAMILHDNPEGVVTLGDMNFKEAVSKYPRLVVDCWAEWCAPCKVMSPFIEELARQYSGRVVYGKLNVDENPGISSEFQITAIPTVLIFQNGIVAGSLQGALPKPMLESEVNKALKMIIV